MIPIKIITTEQAKTQWDSIKEKTYDAAAIVTGLQTRPGQNPENVFDFDDNIRIILSRERALTGDLVIHMSASQHHSVYKNDELMKLAVLHYNEVVGIFPIEFVGTSEGNIPHWVHIFHN